LESDDRGDDDAAAARWLSTSGAARYLGISERTLYRLADDGEVTVFRFGRVYRYRRDDLDKFIAVARVEPGTLGKLRPRKKP
jgi:excisionase family DNA binding protein